MCSTFDHLFLFSFIIFAIPCYDSKIRFDIWKGVPCTHGEGGAGSPFTLAPVSREFTFPNFHKKWMPRSSPTRGGLGVREFHNGHPSNIRVSDISFLALYDAMCFNLPNHPSVSNIKQALLLKVGNFAKESAFSQALLSWKSLVFLIVLYCINRTIKVM